MTTYPIEQRGAQGGKGRRARGFHLGLCTWLALALLASAAQAVVVNVEDDNGASVVGFRWLVEEDDTYDSVPGVADPHTLAVSFHRSYMPVVAKGHSESSSAEIQLPSSNKRYFVSALPDAGYTNSGAPIAAGQGSATIRCSALPLPTAQISIFVFEDNSPINNTPDLPEESGLAGFKVVLYEAGGTYGMSGGQMMQDIFGNPLGTTYDAGGNVMTMGNGVFTTDANGLVTIKNLAQGKYTIQAVPPTGEDWHQTATIEGTLGIDAWVKPNEPAFFQEFGPPGWHVFIGFVRTLNDTSVLTGGNSISGQVVNLHNSRPPDYRFFAGEPVTKAWVGLNELSVGNGKGIYTAPCDMDGKFSISNVPSGNYQVVFWDEPLDMIFASHPVTVAGSDVDLGKVPVFSWFAKVRNQVFNDKNENGFPDPGEDGIPNVNVNLRFRDGSIYQSYVTDLSGNANFEETFPFFNWLVAEVGYDRFKPTGATIVVDGGGQVMQDQGWDYPSFNVLNPQSQLDADTLSPLQNPNTGNNLSKTEMGPFPVLLEGFQAFLGQTNYIAWGKTNYNTVDVDNPPIGNFPSPEDVDANQNGEFDPGNGGIAGIVHYATTRAEDDPRFAAAENWEPGIPRVQINLYEDVNDDQVIDDLNGDGQVTLADVDNWPFTWRNYPYEIGPEDLDRNSNGIFDPGDAVNLVATDSWDDNQPTGAQGPSFTYMGLATDCYDGLRNYNQVRPAVFDGGYIFLGKWQRNTDGTLVMDVSGKPVEAPGLPEGFYIVEADAPPGYEHQKEEDKNVTFGDTYTPAVEKSGQLELYPPCVGDPHLVPPYLSLFTDQQVPCALAGQTRPLPDRKQVNVTHGQNPPCDFHMFTEVPVAGHIVGMILNDLANEFDPNAPTFGEKYAPPWLPISIRDYTGKEISRVYADQWGTYNALVPSTYSINPPFPSGVSPKLVTVVLNSPGPILDTDPASPTHGQYITDPYFNRQYSQFSYTFQYNPGKTTYLDTPVLPIAAFTGPGQLPLDCEFPDATPVIWSVENGPYVSATGQTITIASAGPVDVPNPLYDANGTQPITVRRDYGFGTTPGKAEIGGVALSNVTWTDGSIQGTVAPGTKTGELLITRSNGTVSPVGITVTVGLPANSVHQVQPSSAPGATPIQNAIDAASPGDLILIAPGNYEESVIMWKPVQLQGWGAYSTIINAVKTPAERLQAWRDKVAALAVRGDVDLLLGQAFDFGGIEPGTFNTEEGAGIFVLAKNATPANGGFGPSPNARIDGVTVTGADHGGGIVVNGYARYLEIANNNITNNQGFYGGGIRVGHPEITAETPGGLAYENAHNDHVKIHHNHIDENGGLGGAGGGIAIHTGADDYRVTDNYICGNFIVGNGAGIGHQGLSTRGVIARNIIVFNQSFDQGTNPSGGGIYIGGGPPLNGAGLSPGSGTVEIDGNVIQSNQAGAGDGGGIRTEFVNGEDVLASTDPLTWYTIDITNNFIVNNIAGLAGGGISLQDTALSHIVNNTVAHNDSTATAGLAFPAGNPNQSAPQPAGIVSHAHSAELNAALAASAAGAPYAGFSNPLLQNNIIRQNRSFYFALNNAATPPYGLLPDPSRPVYNDLAVLGVPGASLNPRNCLLTTVSGYDASNKAGYPRYVSQYFNGAPGETLVMQEATTAIAVAAAFDEGGNFIDVHFGPLTRVNPSTGKLYGDYHILANSTARDIGSLGVLSDFPRLSKDYDRELRPNGGVDAGADEYHEPTVANSVPLAVDDVFTVRNSLILGVQFVSAPGVLANDYDANGDALQATLVSGPSNGLVNFNSNGSFTYVTLFFTGTDSFKYKVNDGKTDSNVATVSLRVTRQGNQRPTAVNDSYDVLVNTTLTIPRPGVLVNDRDSNGDTLIARLTTNVRHGTLKLNGSGAFTYTPAVDYIGQDSFRYVAYDGLFSNTATVTLRVGAPPVEENVPPVPTATAITVKPGMTGSTRVVPYDPNFNDVHTYEISTAPAHGAATITPAGMVIYTPEAGFLGADSLVVTVTDQGGLSATATVDIMVEESPMAPPYTGLVQRGGPDDLFIHLAAGDGFVKMADGRVVYCFGFSDMTNVPDQDVMMEGMMSAEFPGPTIVAKEGQKIYLNLTNVGMKMRPDLFDQHTVHWHGFPQAAPVFDGEPEASISVNMGATVTYYYEPVEPGTYMYHCHREASEHMQMGMLANLYVTPKQDGTSYTWQGRTYTQFAYNDGDGSTGYDVAYPIQLGGFDPVFHGRGYEHPANTVGADEGYVPDDQRPRVSGHAGGNASHAPGTRTAARSLSESAA